MALLTASQMPAKPVVPRIGGNGLFFYLENLWPAHVSNQKRNYDYQAGFSMCTDRFTYELDSQPKLQ